MVFSSSPFPQKELTAWWLAYDVACLANKELASADLLLRDNHLPRLAARSVTGTQSPEVFARHVPTYEWHPIDTSIRITDIKSIVERFGGEKLYGSNPAGALRELLQNAVDAVHACRSLGGLNSLEGEIEIALETDPDGYWLHVIDTGIGMSRYVLTEVLLDFGRSLWNSADLRGEWSGLSASGFEAIGQFGIGFFSVFMLGARVQVATRRYEHKENEASQWLLEFTDGTRKRPTLRVPSGNEKLKKHGTRVSVLISQEKLEALLKKPGQLQKDLNKISFLQACSLLAPMIDIDLYTKDIGGIRQLAVKANDWLLLPSLDLLRRIKPANFEKISGDNFGIWSHLSELRDGAGRVIGRCAVQTSGNFGIGTVKGLLAGTVERMAGVILSKPQSDLARRESIPDISLSEVQSWAEKQKLLLLEHGHLGASQSALLACFGSSYTGLTLGQFGGKSLTYEEFIAVTQDMDKIFVHYGDIEHDNYYDDDVSLKNFEDGFEAVAVLLELSSTKPPDWLDNIDDDVVSRNKWSMESALISALSESWGKVEWDHDNVAVGDVNGTSIIRQCQIVTRVE